MVIRRLVVGNVRNLRRAEICPSAGLNRIGGRNGSGKTSLLEAIQILGTGQSFRSGELGGVISRGEGALEVYGELEGGSDQGVVRVGLRRDMGGGGEIRIDGESVRGVMELARRLPLMVMAAGSERVVEAGPSERRRVVDWGVFHVEHHFGGLWRDARRVLGQRNGALKCGASEEELREWDRLWVELSERIEELRGEYACRLASELTSVAENRGLPAGMGMAELEYRAGWPEAAEADRGAWLSRQRGRERTAGVTLYGAHRGDLWLGVDGAPARHRLSRGQQKGLVFALRLAQVQLLKRERGITPVLVIDDLGAELDQESVAWVLREYGALGLQAFVTGVEAESYPTVGWGAAAMFHVEQGKVSEVV